jgi:hypothetical protein
MRSIKTRHASHMLALLKSAGQAITAMRDTVMSSAKASSSVAARQERAEMPAGSSQHTSGLASAGWLAGDARVIGVPDFQTHARDRGLVRPQLLDVNRT